MSIIDKITGKTPAPQKTAGKAAEKKPVASAKKAEKPAAAAPKSEKPTVAIKADKPTGKSAVKNHGVYGILVAPLVTEKSAKAEQYQKYTFSVTINATKSEIIKAVETRYGVKPVKVNILNALGKTKRSGRNLGKRKDWRKAIITLPKGKSINVYESVK